MSSQLSVQKKYDTLYNDAKKFFLDTTSGKLTVATVTILTRYTMEVVQTGKDWAGLKGSEKKDLVLGVLNELIKDFIEDPDIGGENFPQETREAILAALAVAPMFIDAAVDFAKVYVDSLPQEPEARRQRLRSLFCC